MLKKCARWFYARVLGLRHPSNGEAAVCLPQPATIGDSLVEAQPRRARVQERVFELGCVPALRAGDGQASTAARLSEIAQEVLGSDNRRLGLYGCGRVKRCDQLAGAKSLRAAEAIAQLGGRVDAQGVIDGRREVGRAEAARERVGAQAVGLADQLATHHAGAGEDGREDPRPVIAARDGIGGEPRNPRGPAELAEHHHQGIVEQAANLEVVQKR